MQAGAQIFACPRCGQARPMPLHGAMAPCPACGDSTQLPPEKVATAIDAARSAELNLAFREMQMHAVNEARTPPGEWARFAFWWAIPAVLVSIPMMISWRSIIWAYADPSRIEEFIYECLLHLSLPAHVVLGWIVWRERVASQRARLALVEQRPADNVAMFCQFCGAPMTSRSLDEVVVTCAHCKRQTVMDARALASRAQNELVAYARTTSKLSTYDDWALPVASLCFTFVVLILMFLRIWDGKL